MLTQSLRLHPDWQDRKKGCRDGFGEALLELGARDERVVVLTADLAESTRVLAFAKAFPQRFFEMGVAEQNMMGVAAGMAAAGKIPFVTSYGVFSPGRNWDQLRVSVCYSKANVKVIGSHAGLSVGADGATHQALEDIAITRVLPSLSVLSPCDAQEANLMTKCMYETAGPFYMRFGRENTAVLIPEHASFELGKSRILSSGTDVTVLSTGSLLEAVLHAQESLKRQQIDAQVIHAGSIKPFDAEGLVRSAQVTGCVVTVEDHQVAGGLGGLAAEVLASSCPVPIETIGMHDAFGESGSPEELYQKYHMTSKDVVAAVKKVIGRKNKQKIQF